MSEIYQDTLKALINYLKDHGYPETSLAIEWKIGKYRVDLAILEPESKESITLFELKGNAKYIDMGKMQLAAYANALGKPSRLL